MAVEYVIPTPEGVALTYELAGIGSRSLAATIDFIIMVIAFIAICLGAVGLALLGSNLLSDAAVIFLLTSINLLLWGYYIFFETLWEGQSPGKRRMGLRVVSISGTPVTFIDSVIRNLVRVVDFLPSFYGLGIVVMFISPQSRRLGDFAAGTIVVRERSTISLREILQSAEAIADPVRDEAQWNIMALGPEDERGIRNFLELADRIRPVEMRERRAQALARDIAKRIRAGDVESPEPFLVRVLALARGGALMTEAPPQTDQRRLAWDIRQLTEEDERLIAEFLNRAPDLNPRAREQLGNQLATRIAEAVGADSRGEPEAFLREVLLSRRAELS